MQSHLDAHAGRQLAFKKAAVGADMRVLLLLAGACLAGLVSGCAAVDPVDLRYDTINRSLAKARNESILVNLIRASQDYPLNFVTISNVTPTLTNISTLGLPTFLFGPGFVSGNANSLFTPGRDVIFSNNVASNSTSVSTNFSVSTQETTSFYQGFLKPIDLQVLHYFIRQGYSRDCCSGCSPMRWRLTSPAYDRSVHATTRPVITVVGNRIPESDALASSYWWRSRRG